jgi:hypothetical protein
MSSFVHAEAFFGAVDLSHGLLEFFEAERSLPHDPDSLGDKIR